MSARVIDSHTGGEPTRLLVSGGPDLGRGSMAERLARLRDEHDGWRRALVNEPRGNDVIVGAVLCEPADPANLCGVIFCNNVGYLGMCGHGTIGLVATLRYLGRIEPGVHRIETPVGVVSCTLHEDGSVTLANVLSYRLHKQAGVDVPGHGRVHGDVAWGGNWFFLCQDHGLEVDTAHLGELQSRAEDIRAAIERQGLRGAKGAVIDHIELLGPPRDPAHHGRAFVMCPGGAYDRSPCGTGTSAKLACLAAEGLLAPGQTWLQESVIGSVFSGHYEIEGRGESEGRGKSGGKGEGEAHTAPAWAIRPFIRGRAHVTLDAQVVFDPADPLAWGLHSA